MTRDDLLKMAQEAGWVIRDELPYMDYQAVQDALIERLQHFAALVAAAEREECAKVCEELAERFHAHAADCATTIRARSQP